MAFLIAASADLSSVALRSLPRLKTPMRARMESAGRVAECFKAAVLKTARARKGPRGFESHPFPQSPVPGRRWLTLLTLKKAHTHGHSPHYPHRRSSPIV